jgi:DNA-binding transcriptional ArsR family regulator
MKEERCDLLCVDAPRAEAIRGALLDSVSAREAAERARALSDPTRLVLAVALREGGELCVCDLAWITRRAQNLVSHHLRCLRVDELEDGYELSFPGGAQWAIKLTEFIIFERGCCPFFAFELVFEPGEGPIRLRVRGPEGVKDLVAEMTGSLAG